MPQPLTITNAHFQCRQLILICLTACFCFIFSTPVFAYADNNLSLESWGAIFSFTLIIAISLFLTFQQKFKKQHHEQQQLDKAYHSIEKEMNDRTQKLRAINNELYDEITQRKITETQLDQARIYLHSIINSMPSILVGVTAEGKITHWNTSAEKATGHTEDNVIGKYLVDSFPYLPIDISMIQSAIKDKTPKPIENVKHVYQGEVFYSDITVYPLIADNLSEAVIRVDDVTLRVSMEKKMIQNEKMMSLGELAAGMAHEINNPLGAILQNVQNIERRTTTELKRNQNTAQKLGTNIETIEKYLEEREIKKLLADIREASERSSKMVANMLDFSRGSQGHVAININHLVRHCLELADNNFKITTHIPTNDSTKKTKTIINITTSFAQKMPGINGSPEEIQQVILNILRNASQAFQHYNNLKNKPPTINLATSKDENNIYIKIKDNGDGMPEEIRRNIFEPFFTTKEAGKGTGLGLSISYFIITEHHDGNIEVKSSPRQGTEFIISLPIAKK